MMQRELKGRAVLIALLLPALGGAALRRAETFHELKQTSATVVVREGGHVEVRLQVPWADVLHDAWMPQRTMEEFLMQVTAQRADSFARHLGAVQAQISRGVRVLPDGGEARGFSRWQWPRPRDVQEALRRELMSRMAEPGNFEHASRLLATAELSLGGEPLNIRLRIPAVLGPVLLTVYRPSEQWLAPGALSAPVALRRSSGR